MVNFRRYPEYQSTKYPWIGDLPISWEVRRLKEVGRLFGGAGFPHEYQNVQGEELYFYKVGDLSLSENGKTLLASPHTISKETAKTLRASIIPENAVVYAKIGAALLLNRRRMTTAACCVDNNMTAYVIAAEMVSPEWAFYWLSTIDFGEHVNPGAVPSFSEGYQSVLPIPVPPMDEQQAIARFLDFKAAQIDALIAKKKALLDKLTEKRAALISHAVTKGLDPKAPMKNSGVTWLGQIPAHWTALPLRRLIQTVKTGTTPAGVNEFHFSDSGVSWFRPGDFSNQVFIESAEKKLSDEGVAEVRVFPALTVMHVGIGATIGKVGVTTEPSSCNQQINAIVCNERLHHLFAAYFLQAIKEYIVKCGKYTTLPIINQDETKALCFTVPPVDEQVEISEYLLREEQLMEQQAKKISQMIARLQEYRSALITNAVTGKIDVRNAPIAQPPEA